jgi:hypothetical protein
MKKINLVLGIGLVLILMVGLTACFPRNLSIVDHDFTRGNGKMIDAAFSYSGSIEDLVIDGVPGSFNISAEKGNEITYTIDENLADLIEIEFDAGMLTIKTVKDVSISSRDIVFNINADTLKKTRVNGAAEINGIGTFNTDEFVFELNGAATADFDINAGNVLVDSNGAGAITLSGTADKLNIKGNGAGTVNTKELLAVNVTVVVNGAGSVEVYAEKTLDISVTGTGSITYWGNPQINKSGVGVGSIKKGE